MSIKTLENRSKKLKAKHGILAEQIESEEAQALKDQRAKREEREKAHREAVRQEATNAPKRVKDALEGDCSLAVLKEILRALTKHKTF